MRNPAPQHTTGNTGQSAGTARLARGVLGEIESHLGEHYPYEACGLLLGEATDSGYRVERAVACANLEEDSAEDTFQLDPEDYREADELAKKEGLEIVGVYHSHPDHPAEPSDRDLQRAWRGWVYLITTTGAEGVGETTAWELAQTAEEFVQLDLTTEEN